ncbi:TraU family protein [Neiella marina]|uniref:TraU family protein n=1 Tax=Neiella holothuriorum TaxID=2870530 RepID=A0ABS7EHB5_9GAMM|nr:TraU family protein [Neiella holothuriorum]MBW8191288.1 TraU family protein [Neiella holothuriorum]
MSSQAADQTCGDAKIFEKMFDQICWDCVVPMTIMGVGYKPDGASSSVGACACFDALGMPDFGWPLGGFQPVRLNEVVQEPWCSPSLGGISLQDDFGGYGTRGTSGDSSSKAFYNYHYFSYPIMEILELFLLPDCDPDPWADFDMLYLSEIDPMWSDDMLSMLLTREAYIFANPLAISSCMVDGITITATGEAIEEMYYCAGTDGNLYPHTGNVGATADPVRNSSLITQRVLASLHRKGLALKTMGDEEMCEPSYIPFLPRSQYKFSMVHPLPQADSSGPYGCCQTPGDSHHKWSTAAGGRQRPGDKDYVWLIWRWTDCCVRDSF